MAKRKDGSGDLLREEHFGKWVAFSADRTKIVAFSDSLKDLSQKVGDVKVVYEKATYPDRLYAF